jgi:hypothetical protein
MIAFVRIDTHTIMDGLVVRYQRGDEEISASRNGVSINLSTWGLKRPEQFLIIKKYIDRAYRQYDKLGCGQPVIPEDELDFEETNRSTNNILAILEELIENGDGSPEALIAWFSGEHEVIKQAVEDAKKILA